MYRICLIFATETTGLKLIHVSNTQEGCCGCPLDMETNLAIFHQFPLLTSFCYTWYTTTSTDVPFSQCFLHYTSADLTNQHTKCNQCVLNGKLRTRKSFTAVTHH